MKTQYILSLLAATAMFAGCAKENASENIPELGENQFFATMEDGAKTILNREDGDNHNQIFWEESDIISINGSLYTVEPINADPRKAIFTLIDGQDVPSAPYKAYYPESIYNGGTLTLPSTITYNAEDPFDGVFPMYAVSAGSRNLMFRNVCGLLEIKLTGIDKIKSLTVSDESKAMSGTFTIDENHNAVIDEGEGNTGVTINLGEGVQLNPTTPKVFYVPVPAWGYTSLKITSVSAEETRWERKSKPDAIATVQRNKIYSFSFTVGSPFGGNNEEIEEINGIW